MGRIKTMLVKRTARQLVEQTPDSFEKEFDHNKKALAGTIGSKQQIRQLVVTWPVLISGQSRPIVLLI